ncbi:phospho-sugar mutase [Staphylococcus simulans]|uniref:phospho-sugar mutase n=1 Tax=Staphylococcus simulans TaxID=1286 RepID=UPI000D1FC6C2|nr:phospho-sugar mutase [Staphylococcus simulans]PTI88450.1 phosphoglucomutase [Staphylococcus simulans]RIN49073.1 phospho-sugar mutase [Staphylococcus simulans]UXR51917.1 phospho-sugar mutase [Staphylococcus simulans]
MKLNWENKIDESLVSAFYKDQTENIKNEGFEDTLAFGTAGIRGLIGLGPGRLNAFTVRKVAVGLAKYLSEHKPESLVVIHFDTRFLSEEFAHEIAAVLAQYEVKAVVGKRYNSTPELSFAVRYLEADAGVMITASHNPKEYNGIKIYGADGGQLLPQPSEMLSSYINQIEDPLDIEGGNFEEGLNNGFITYLSEDVTEAYKAEVIKLVDSIPTQTEKIALTSLHGTSLPILSEIFEKLNYSNYVIEKEQSQPDGSFPTVAYANPEEEQAFTYSLRLADQEDAQLILATDPDADRFGMIERYKDGTHRYFNGNEIGLILLKLRYDQLNAEGTNQPLYMVKSIVSSAASDRLAQALDLESNTVLTGFKFISEILQNKQDTDEQLVLGYEESHGYLAAPFSRDKDAIQMIPLVVKYKNELAQQGKTFKKVLDEVFALTGIFKDKTISPKFEGASGRQKINDLLESFRKEQPDTLLGLKVKQIEDYQTKTITDLVNHQTVETTLPQSNLIRFILDEGFIALRPSGTEPKIKVYFSLNVEDLEAVVTQFEQTYLD